jgi:hypothetical protein
MPNRRFPIPVPPAAIALLLLASGVATAGDGDALPARPLDRTSLWLGGFQARSDTTLTATARFMDYSASGSVNLEDDLGLDDVQPVSHARLDFLVGESQGFSFDYFGYRRSNSKTLSRDIDFDGQTYRASAEVRGKFDYDFGSAAYRWWFGEGATAYGLGLGVAYYRVRTLLEGEVSLDEDSLQAGTRSSDDALAPLLALGWRHGFSDKLRVYADLSGVAKGGGGLSGHIVDAAVGLEWFPFKRVGLALEYGATTIRLDRRKDFIEGRLDLDLQGPSLFLRLR